MSRWFRVSADIFEHELFAQAELSEREAWLWLVAKAAWKDTRHRIGAEVVAVPRGTMFCTLRELRDEWRWKSDFRVRSFLEMLEREAMIARNANAGKTHLTICNYDKYQSAPDDVQRTENAEETHGKRTENALKIPVYQDTKEDTSLRSVSAPAREKSQSEKFNPRKALLALGCPERSVDGWLEVRKAKRAPLTEVALEKLKSEAGKAGLSVPDAVQICAEKSWQSFQADWKFDRPKSSSDPPSAAVQQVFVIEGTKAWDEWCANYASRGKGYPPCKESRDHGFKRGWWFPTEYPPPINTKAERAA